MWENDSVMACTHLQQLQMLFLQLLLLQPLLEGLGSTAESQKYHARDMTPSSSRLHNLILALPLPLPPPHPDLLLDTCRVLSRDGFVDHLRVAPCGLWWSRLGDAVLGG